MLDEPLSNIDLENYASKLKLPLVGVFNKDQLPRIQVGSYYINMQDADDGPGTHWVLLKIIDKKNVFYFDSFGAPPPQEVLDFVKVSIPYSNRIIQDIDSDKCGYYVLACDDYMSHIKRKDMREQFDDFLNMFVYDSKRNDNILKDYLKTKI